PLRPAAPAAPGAGAPRRRSGSRLCGRPGLGRGGVPRALAQRAPAVAAVAGLRQRVRAEADERLGGHEVVDDRLVGAVVDVVDDLVALVAHPAIVLEPSEALHAAKLHRGPSSVRMPATRPTRCPIGPGARQNRLAPCPPPPPPPSSLTTPP